jgi:hypothetical protein
MVIVAAMVARVKLPRAIGQRHYRSAPAAMPRP